MSALFLLIAAAFAQAPAAAAPPGACSAAAPKGEAKGKLAPTKGCIKSSASQNGQVLRKKAPATTAGCPKTSATQNGQVLREAEPPRPAAAEPEGKYTAPINITKTSTLRTAACPAEEPAAAPKK